MMITQKPGSPGFCRYGAGIDIGIAGENMLRLAYHFRRKPQANTRKQREKR
jgi:hypothetical protein